MEKRLGTVSVLVHSKESVSKLNTLLSDFSSIIRARFGLPFAEKGVSIISLIVEGDTDKIGALSGKIGRLRGVEVKSLLTRYKEESIDTDN